MFHVLFNGLGDVDFALNMNRLTLGVFFAISGYHKLFNSARHQMIATTLEADLPVWVKRCVPVKLLCWAVPSIEFCGGLVLIIGFVSPLAALALFGICLVATCTDGVKRIPSWHPIDKADVVDDVLYLPEVLYCFGLLIILLAGPGSLSLDHIIVGLF